MNTPKALLLFPVILVAGVSLISSGCKQQVNLAHYNATQWTNDINAPKLSESEFVRLFALREAAELTNLQVQVSGRRELTVKFSDRTKLKQFLDNVWADVRTRPDRVEMCERYIASLKETQRNLGDSSPVDTNSIVAVVRDDQFLQQMEKYANKATNRVVSEPLAADLHVVYGRDSQRGIAYLTEGDRAQLGLAPSDLRKLALINLHRIIETPRRAGTNSLYMILADGTYESSLLLADKLWDSQAQLVQGEIIAAVPARDVLMFTGSGSPEGLQKFRQGVDAIYKDASHQISKTLLVRRKGRWEKFEQDH